MVALFLNDECLTAGTHAGKNKQIICCLLQDPVLLRQLYYCCVIIAVIILVYLTDLVHPKPHILHDSDRAH